MTDRVPVPPEQPDMGSEPVSGSPRPLSPERPATMRESTDGRVPTRPDPVLEPAGALAPAVVQAAPTELPSEGSPGEHSTVESPTAESPTAESPGHDLDRRRFFRQFAT